MGGYTTFNDTLLINFHDASEKRITYTSTKIEERTTISENYIRI